MTVIVEEVVLPPLAPSSSTFVADPAYADVVEMEYDCVTAASPTSGPNRLTVHVPTERTVLSLGAPNGRWNTDVGITGYTDHHIHFETKAHDKTVVSLGGPATTAAIAGHGGALEAEEGGGEGEGEGGAHAHEGGEPTEGGEEHAGGGEQHASGADAAPGGQAKKAPGETEGYSMVTAERAWHESTGQHYLLSQEGDISLRTMGANKRATIQADHGHVDLNGGEEVNLSGGGVAIGAVSEVAFEHVLPDGTFTGEAPHSTFKSIAKIGASILSAAASVHDLVLKVKKTRTKYQDGKFKWNESSYVDVPKFLLDAAKATISTKKIVDTLTSAPAPPGCVKISASQNVGGVAGGTVAFTGALAASMSSAGVASVGGGLMATLKAVVFAGVGGSLTSIKGRKKVEISSATGNVVLNAKANVELSANEVEMGAHKWATITANEQLLFGAGHRAWIGAEPGWGLLFDGEGIAFGKASGTDKMKTAKIEDEPSVRIDSKKIEMLGAKGSISLTDDLCFVDASAVTLKAKRRVKFNGRRAKLGA
jgi:hypothetical protein